MFSVLIGIIVGSLAKTWMQLAGATVIVVAVVTLVVNFAYNMWLLSQAGIPLTVSLRDWANLALAFAINLLLALIGAAVAFGFRRVRAVAIALCGCARSATMQLSADTFQLVTSAAPICGRAGAQLSACPLGRRYFPRSDAHQFSKPAI